MDYHSRGPNWNLSVSDNGRGFDVARFDPEARPDPLLEPQRFFRLLRQVHDAERKPILTITANVGQFA